VDIIPWDIHGQIHIQERNHSKELKKVRERKVKGERNVTRRIARYQYIRNIYI